MLPRLSTAATLYVDLNCANPVPPYSDWSTASTNIQVAVDAASAGDVVLVTNGVYSVGGRVSQGVMNPSRVAVEKALTLASVNGPEVTLISGNGARCVYLTNGAVLAGFTITNGSSGRDLAGGGVYCTGTNSLVTNCILIRNSGGAYQGTIDGCILFSNTGSIGGGANRAVLRNCAIAGNTGSMGGGAANSQLIHCTLTGNSASSAGGGAYQSALNNCIVYYNMSPSGSNTAGCELNYSCTTPLPQSGAGNITSEPQLASVSHPSPASPCRAAGSPAYPTVADIDGQPWASPPSMGCDEYWAGEVRGSIHLSIVAGYTNFAAGLPVEFKGWVLGAASSSAWNFGDGTVVSNQLFATHSWADGGDFNVVLTGWNDDNPGGISATVTVHVAGQPIHYVWVDSTNPVPPYTSWATAARDIQSAVDAATSPGESVVVSNGVYRVGGRQAGGSSTTNRVSISQAITVRSVNGPLVTVIEGRRAGSGGLGPDAIRCVYLASGAVLDGFTLTNGATALAVASPYEAGGGVRCQSGSALVTNCMITRNFGHGGGGAFLGSFLNCSFRGNSAYESGGACQASTLNNCILEGNGANVEGGGGYSATLNNCLIRGNTASNNGEAFGGGASYCTLNNCVLDDNNGDYGGGMYEGTANNCTFTNNWGYFCGGGMYNGTANNSLLIGNGAGDVVYTTSAGGGAAYYGTLNSCRILNNYGAYRGGGTYNSTVNNSVLTGNWTLYGGGAYGGTLKNCTITGNSGFFGGGGVMQATAYNSILQYNSQGSLTNNYAGVSTISYCCTSPDPGSGSGNITNEPAFADVAASDFHLQPASPCVNAGNNGLISGATDLDGKPRISGGIVDLGAYEFQNPSSVLSYAWLQQYGLPTDGSADFLDSDGDGMNNWAEWRAGTTPTEALSVLRMLSPTWGASGVTITWQSVSGIQYFVQRADLAAPADFSTIKSNLVGAAGTTSFVDTNALGRSQALYRIGVP